MTKKMKKGGVANYKKIQKLCKIMIDDLSDKVTNINELDHTVKLWKNEDSVLEIVTKLVSILNKLQQEDKDEPNNNDVNIEQISKNDFLTLEEFVKNYNNKVKV